MTIETKKVASVNEAISIINRLNYTNETFHYTNSTFSDDYKVEYRFCDGVRDNGLYSGMSIIEIVADGTLQTVRFFNHFRDITVDLRIGDFLPDYDRFDTVINVNAVSQPIYKMSTVETKIAKNGARMYYADGKRISKATAEKIAYEAQQYALKQETCDKLAKVVFNEYESKNHIACVENGYTAIIGIKYNGYDAVCCSRNYVTIVEAVNAVRYFAEIKNAFKFSATAYGSVESSEGDNPDLYFVLGYNGYQAFTKKYYATIAAETDGSEDDIDETFIAVIPADDDDTEDELVDPPVEDKIFDNDLTVNQKLASTTINPFNSSENATNNANDKKNIPVDNNVKDIALTDDFDIDEKIAELKADFDRKSIELDKADAELFKARELAREAEQKAYAAENAKFKAKCAWLQALSDKSKALTVTLMTPDILHSKNFKHITTQNGYEISAFSFFALRISNAGEAWEINSGFLTYGKYDNIAQVTDVINQLKDAIKRGDTEFKFPTVEELIKPPEVKTTESDNLAHTETKKDFRDRYTDSLIRAMKINLEKFQEFCRVKNLVEAQNEMKLYTICSRAMSKLWATDKFLTIHTD